MYLGHSEPSEEFAKDARCHRNFFSLYINGFAEFLEMRWAPVVSLANNLFSFLLFVDDTALVAKSAEELQTLLNLTESYLESKKLKLNASKTEIVIFQSRKPNGPQDYSFTYKDEAIKVTQSINIWDSWSH